MCGRFTCEEAFDECKIAFEKGFFILTTLFDQGMHMISERSLNGFLTSNLDSLGFIHISSEVSRVYEECGKYKYDILAYDRSLKIPIVIELKVKKDAGVICQIDSYINAIETYDIELFQKMADFNKDRRIDLNFNYGVMGIIVSPEKPLSIFSKPNTTIVWLQYDFDNGIISFRHHELISRREYKKIFNIRSFKPSYPHNVFISTQPSLSAFIDKLHVEIIGAMGSYVYCRPQLSHHYIEYFGGELVDKGFFGFNAQGGRGIKIEYHVKKDSHLKFLQSKQASKFPQIGLSIERPRKDLIFPIELTERDLIVIGNNDLLIQAFVDLAKLAYELNISKEAQDIKYGNIDNYRNGITSLIDYY